VTPNPLPLADAAKRLRRRPGRPPNPPGAVATKASAPPATPPLTRAHARAVAVVWLKRNVTEEGEERPEWFPASARLVGLHAAAAYVGVSTWVIRGWETDGVLSRVRLPSPGGGEMDRLLFDVADLDALIEAGKG
jgi:hypothetical protein